MSNERNVYNVLSVNSFFDLTPEERRMLMENLLEGKTVENLRIDVI